MTYPKPTIIAAIAAARQSGWTERSLIIDTAAALLAETIGGTVDSAEQQVIDMLYEAAA
ncbi:hypothetical protein Q0601_00735 [Paracoccus onubensis]|uniref:hypothetical protein n=1 Tax=Paracoccus onubensis TaxID=1675788 RepID=UPI00272F924A|nr:hypothetical protein [Paracoccus onubensis]MDP0925687.1 hypothetical protein [Paracoccus onubensis]